MTDFPTLSFTSTREIPTPFGWSLPVQVIIRSTTPRGICLGNSMTFKIVQNTTSHEAASGIWIILKYYEPVLLPNTTFRAWYYLFKIQAKKFSATHNRPLFLYD